MPAHALVQQPADPFVLSRFMTMPQNHDAIKGSLVHDVLEHHAEEGDVQTCVMLVLVLGDLLDPPVAAHRRRMWLCSYIDLLQQQQVYSVAARVIAACNDQEVEKRYRMSSMIAEGCSSCASSTVGNPAENRRNFIRADVDFKGACGACKSTISRCAICEQAATGVFVWCQGCGHGGHLSHMSEWFETASECPTGCGHICTMQAAKQSQAM